MERLNFPHFMSQSELSELFRKAVLLKSDKMTFIESFWYLGSDKSSNLSM